jgi:hypothetical protein
MRFTEIISESSGTRLKDIAKIATNMPDADFWLIRKGSDKTVGKPVKEFDPSRIGVKVVRTDVLDPNYLYYAMMNLHNQGHFARISNGTTNLVNITVNDIANIPLGQQTESLNELAPSTGGEGDNNYLKTLASAWYNMDLEMLGDIIKQGKSALDHRMNVQDTIEKMLGRGIHCPDGKVRKYFIGYNAEFDGADIQSHDHYEYADYDNAGRDIDSRTGKPWGPYDVIQFAGNELDESVIESKERYTKMKIEELIIEGENWSKHNNKRVGGMSKKSVSSYRRSHPGSKIQTAVTTKPSKLKKGSKAAKRRKSFCARMKGMKKSRTSAKTARDPNSNINKSLRRWNCESIEQMEELLMLAEQMVAKARKEIL